MSTLELIIAAAGSATGAAGLWAARKRIARWIARQDWEIKGKRRPEMAELERENADLRRANAALLAQAAACQAHADSYRDQRDNARALLESELARKHHKG